MILQDGLLSSLKMLGGCVCRYRVRNKVGTIKNMPQSVRKGSEQIFGGGR